MSILVIGESCLDVFKYGVCNRLCPEAPVPVFNPVSETVNGGMAYNVYSNLLSLKVPTEIQTNSNYENITKTRYIDSRANYMFMRLDENDDQYPACDIDTINFSLYEAIVISDYNKGFLTTEDIERIGNSHPLVFLDTKKILGNWSSSITYIKINEDEYEKTKHTLEGELLKKLIITMGAEGARHVGVTYPVPKVEIKDTSGAGDTFVASLVCEYVKSRDIETAICFANKNATKVVQKKGVAVI